VEIKEESTVVPAERGNKISLEPYDKWPLPYRGSRYSLIETRINGKRKKVVAWKHRDFEPLFHQNKDGEPVLPINLIRAFREIGKSGGRFKVTPYKEVITTVKGGRGAFYLGKLKGEWNFEGIDLNPEIEKFGIWNGLSFNHGECWSVWVRKGAGTKLYWSVSRGWTNNRPRRELKLHFESINDFPQLTRLFRDIRPKGGIIYFNEFGHIWMNLPGSQVSPQYEQKIDDKIENWKSDTTKNRRVVLKRLQNTDGCWPIYLGTVDDFPNRSAPRTYFKDLDTYWEGYSNNKGENYESGF